MKKLARLFVALLGLVLVATACAAAPEAIVEVGGDAPAPDADGDSQVAALPPAGTAGASFLLAAPDATMAADALRMDIFMEMEINDPIQGAVEVGSLDRPLGTGDVQGANSSMFMDIGVLFEPILDSLSSSERDAFLQVFGGGDLTMDMIVIGEVTYLRSAFIASTASQAVFLDAEVEPLTNIDTQYGTIDTFALNDDFNLSELSGAGGVNGIESFEAYLNLIRDGVDVVEIGSTEIRGEPAIEYAVTAKLFDLLEAQGMDPSQLGLSSEQSQILDAELDFGVFVGADGRVRRIVFNLDEDAIAQIDTAGEIPPGQSISMTMVMDMYDYNDASISVTAPPADQVFGDVTEAFVAFSSLGE